PDALLKRPGVSALAYQLTLHEMVSYCAADDDFGKLELFGFQVGHRFAERFTRQHARFVNTLEIVKFLCKDFWAAMFGKQVDKLQTNHK
ncbi:unnamed protein product, partial [Durusdinium trenchii]